MGESLDDAISLVGSRVALVAGPGVDNVFLTRVRSLIHSSDPFGSLIGAMTDAGLTNIPSLSCAVTERGGIRLIVRGSGKALVKTVDGRSEVITARKVSTWTEHACREVEEVVLVVPNIYGAPTSLVLFLDAASQRQGRPVQPDERSARAAPLPDLPPPAPQPMVADDITIHVSRAVRPPQGDVGGDHDGNTISLSELRNLTAGGTMAPVVAPLLGRLRFNDGVVVEVDGTLVLGREPRFTPDQGGVGTMPRLVSLVDPDHSLSRTHAEVRVEGRNVLVVDLDSMNGTTVHLPGQVPQVLQPGGPLLIVPGTRVDLGDAVSFTYEEATNA